jgi:acyl carrier protein
MNDVTGRVRGILNACLGQDSVDLAASFQDLGIDSLDTLDLHFHLADEFGCDIPSERLRHFTSGLDLVAYLEGPAVATARLHTGGIPV